VTSNSDTWGASMSVKASQLHTSPTLWADVQLPPNKELEDKEISGTITMKVRFPVAAGGNGMTNGEKDVKKNFTVKLSKVNAWQSFRMFWWVGLVGSILMSLIAGVWLSRMAETVMKNSPMGSVDSWDSPSMSDATDKEPWKRERDRPKGDSDDNEPPQKERPWKRD
jgi:hypothetical protein